MAERLVVVTGASGFIGAALCAYFRSRGVPFIGTVRQMQSGIASDLHPIGDLSQLDDAALEDVVGGADVVVHLAGRAHVMVEAERNPARAYTEANVDLTARLATIAARADVRRFILASSVKVNGERSLSGRPFRPDDPPNPQDAYARSKLAAEQALFDAAKDSRMAAIALRLPLVYGRNAKGNFARLVQAVMSGRSLPLASVRNHRSLLYLGNLVEAIEAAIAAPALRSGVHFVADAEAVSTPDLVRAIAVAWKVKARLFAVPVPMLRIAGLAAGRSVVVARLTDSLEVDTSSFREATRWLPRWSLDAALSRTASQHRAAPLF
jgi:UDP-N-acetyl-alpha-D-quinovosamine dehydrogenase